jgi:LPS-assembly lipoprotein
VGDGATRRALIGGLLLLSGCGFRPIYASRGPGQGPAEAGLETVAVALIPDRPGQLLRQALQARLDHGGDVPKRFDLLVNFALAPESIAIQRDNAATRVRYVGQAAWSLTTRDAVRATITSGSARAVDGMNLFELQYFAADLQAETVTRRIAEALADQIATQLAIHFERHPV